MKEWLTYQSKKTVSAIQWYQLGDEPERFEFEPYITSGNLHMKKEKCGICGRPLEEHAMNQGVIICPGDYIIARGQNIEVMSREDFQKRYEWQGAK